MVMEIIREGLIITPTGSLEPSQGSYNVPVKLINDETYPNYTINMYIGYYINGAMKKIKCETDSEGHYLIPGIAFLRSGIISISFLLETADKSQGLMTNALSYEIKHAPNVVVEVPADPTWQELVKEWIQELAGAVNVDNTLTKSGMAADAKATGDAISQLSDSKANKTYVDGQIAKAQLEGAGVDTSQFVTQDDLINVYDSLSLGVAADGFVYIFVGGVPVGNGLNISGGSVEMPDVYGQPTTDNMILKLTQNQTYTLGVKLDKQPNVNQIVTVLSNSSLLTFDKTELSFTPLNWNEFQYVTVTVGTFEDDTNANIILRNSDELMTDTNIQVYLQAEMFAVDMTIPSGQYTVQASDFTYTTSGNLIIPTEYNGTESNILVPQTMDVDGTTYTVTLGSEAFKGNTTLEYVEINPNVRFGGLASTNINSVFNGCTNLIGLKYKRSNITSIQGTFDGCSSFKWWDGLELNTGIKTMKTAFFGCTSLEYLQDISSFTKLTSMEQCFWLSGLKKIYGMPLEFDNSCTMASAFYGTQISSAIIPKNVTGINYCFSGCTNLRKVSIYEDNLTDANGTFTNCTDVDVYANQGTTTYDTLNSKWGSNSQITLMNFGGGSLPLIVTWGDSTTSEGTSWGCWPDRLQEKLGISNFTVRNEAVSGEYTTSTSVRQGGNTLKILQEFTIPSDTTQVTVPKIGTRDGRTFGVNLDGGNFRPYESFNPCTVNGVVGTFTNTNGYQFTRMEDGEEVVVPTETYVYSNQDDVLNNSNVIMLINLGINSGWESLGSVALLSDPNADCLITQIQMMIDHFVEKGGTKYIVTGPSAGKYLENENHKAIVLDFESKASQSFGEHWLNLREYMIQNGLTENGLEATEEDTTRMSNGLVPKSLLCGNNAEDLTHPNSYGANSQMLAFYNKGVELGYWD